MAAVNVVALLVLGVCLVFAAQPGEHHLNVRVEDQDVVTSESIDVNYERKYVKISSSGSAGTQAGSMLHDYTQGLNVLKRHGECYILDKFRDIPEDIKDWEKVESSITDDVIHSNDSRHVGYVYKAMPYLVNSTTLPASVQEFCPGPIRVVVLEDVKEEDEPRDEDEDESHDEDDESHGVVSDNVDGLSTTIFIPGTKVAPQDQLKLRTKRGLFRRRRRRRRRFWRTVGRVVKVAAKVVKVVTTVVKIVIVVAAVG